MNDMLQKIASMFGSKGMSLNSSASPDYSSPGHSAPYKGAGKPLTPIQMALKGNWSDAGEKAMRVLSGQQGVAPSASGAAPSAPSVGAMGMTGMQTFLQGMNGQQMAPPSGSIIAQTADDSAARMQAAQQLMNQLLASKRVGR